MGVEKSNANWYDLSDLSGKEEAFVGKRIKDVNL
jgi:hypothetical protein